MGKCEYEKKKKNLCVFPAFAPGQKCCYGPKHLEKNKRPKQNKNLFGIGNNEWSHWNDEFPSLIHISPWFLSLHLDECRGLTQETCDISPVLSQAMAALQDRPVLYK